MGLGAGGERGDEVSLCFCSFLKHTELEERDLVGEKIEEEIGEKMGEEEVKGWERRR